MIEPLRNEMLMYRCGVYGKPWWSQRGPMHVSCAVLHSPGTCCHYGEREATEEEAEPRANPSEGEVVGE